MIAFKTPETLVKDAGIKKALSLLLQAGRIIDDDSVGQIICHVNNGGITKICRNNWEIK